MPALKHYQAGNDAECSPLFCVFQVNLEKNQTKTFGALAAPSAELVFLKCYVNSSSLAGPLFLLAVALWLVLTG